MRELSLELRVEKPVERLIQLISPCTTVNKGCSSKGCTDIISSAACHQSGGGIAGDLALRFYQSYVGVMWVNDVSKVTFPQNQHITVVIAMHPAQVCVLPPTHGSGKSQDVYRSTPRNLWKYSRRIARHAPTPPGSLCSRRILRP